MELARQYIEAFNSGGMDANQHWRHPDIEVFDPPNLRDADRHVGEAAVRALVESYMEVGWDGQFWAPEYLDAGEEVVIVWQMRGHSPHGGGFPYELTFAHI